MDSESIRELDGDRARNQRDGKISIELKEFEKRARLRQRLASAAAIVLLAGVAAAVYITAWQVNAKQRELDDLKRQIGDAHREKTALDQTRQRLEDTNRNLIDANQQIEKDIVQKRAYADTIRSILSQGRVAGATESVVLNATGMIPPELKSGIRPRVAVNARAGREGDTAYDVDLWVEMPTVGETAVESVTFDLDERFYQRRHFPTRASPSDHIPTFVVKRCESKVLVTVVLKDGHGSVAIDFDWCKAIEWQHATSSHR